MLNRITYISGWEIRLSGGRLKSWNKVYYSSVCISNKSGYSIQIRGVILVVSIRTFLTTLQIRRSIAGFCAQEIQVKIPVGELKESGKRHDNKKKSVTGVHWEARLYPGINRLLDIFFNLSLKQITIGKVSLPIEKPGFAAVATIEHVNLLKKEGQAITVHGNDLRITTKNADKIFAGTCQLICFAEKETTYTRLKIGLAADQMTINHPAFSIWPVVIKTSSANLDLVINKEKLEIGEGSKMTINDIPVLFQLIYEAQDTDLVKTTLVFTIEGSRFFKSYPFFNHSGLSEIKASGELVIQLNYMLSITDFSKYYFKSDIQRNNFQLIDSGSFFLSNKYIANIINRPVNNKCNSNGADFVCLASLPACFTDVVITAEDPNFYKHSGVDPYYIGVAAAVNLRNRQFKKGASTITMQLCKNLFFQYDKSVSRKIDEMIVSWLLENHLKLSKEQILETYLNIIEFGEGVYGIKAAAKYYFNKEVADISLPECITLTYIIPRPKFFLEALLIQSPQLRANLRKHIGHHLWQLHNNGKISRETFLGTDYVIRFELPALNHKKIILNL